MGFKKLRQHGRSDLCDDWRNPIKSKLKKKECGSIIINKTLDKILLIKGRDGNKWGIPKGHCNDIESVIDCSLRETYEETGIKFTHDSYLKNKKGYPLSFNISKIYALVFIVDESYPINPIDKHEIIDYDWFPIHNLKLIKFQPFYFEYYNSSIRFLIETQSKKNIDNLLTIINKCI